MHFEKYAQIFSEIFTYFIVKIVQYEQSYFVYNVENRKNQQKSVDKACVKLYNILKQTKRIYLRIFVCLVVSFLLFYT